MSMNGAESLVQTLLACGVDTCFANPGTSEMHFVAALDRVPGMRCVLGLFEGVVTGAADGYARMAGKPAVTLLHCGPGLANGLANLHNGRRATTMMVNCVGDQSTRHRPLDAPLTADTEGWARGVSGWVRTASAAGLVGADAAAAVQAARTAPGTIATLILPSDTCWNPGGVPVAPLPVPPAPQVTPQVVQDIARLLRRGEPTMLLLATDALRAAPLADAHRIAAATGAKLWAPTGNRCIERGAGRHPIDRIPYAIDLAVHALAGIQHVDPGRRGEPTGGLLRLSRQARHHDPARCGDARARPPRTRPAGGPGGPGRRARSPAGSAATPGRPPGAGARRGQRRDFAASLAALLPDGAIIADEAVSFGRSTYGTTWNAAPHDWIAITGGAIGDGIPLATGAAVACPGRRVVNLEADGSALYTIQGLWTQARENLDVTTIVFANRKYAILLGELANVGANPGRTALDMMDLTRPGLDFVKIAEGLGVPGARADTMEQFNDLFTQSLERKGPFLIELMVP